MQTKGIVTDRSPTRTLSEFLASIRYEDIPPPVAERTEDLFLAWLASALQDKALRLADYADGASDAEMRKAMARTWRPHDERNVRELLNA